MPETITPTAPASPEGHAGSAPASAASPAPGPDIMAMVRSSLARKGHLSAGVEASTEGQPASPAASPTPQNEPAADPAPDGELTASPDGAAAGQPEAGTEAPAAEGGEAPETEVTADAATEAEEVPQDWTPKVRAEFKARVDKEVRKREELKGQLAAKDAEVAQAQQAAGELQQQLVAARTQQPGFSPLLAANPQELDAHEAFLRKGRRWLIENLEGATVEKDGQTVEHTAAAIRKRLAEVEEELQDIPKARALHGQRAQWDAQVKTVYPELFDAKSTESITYSRFTQEVPQILRFPQARVWVGDAIVGERLRKLSGGKPMKEVLALVEKAMKPAATAPAPKPAPRLPTQSSPAATRPPVKSKPNPDAAPSTDAIRLNGGGRRGLVNAIAAQL